MVNKILAYKGNFVGLMMFLSFYHQANAQSFMGFLSDNYAGVNSVIANPANIVDSRFKADINLVGLSGFGGNDYYNFDFMDAIDNPSYYLGEESRFTPKAINNGELNIDVMGPSFMFNLNPKNSIALITRTRSFLNINGVNGYGLYALSEAKEDFNVIQDGINVNGHAWAEIGLAYAKVLKNTKENFLKGGVTIKYLKGGGSAFASAKDVSIAYDADGSLHSEGGTTGSIASAGHLVMGRFDDFDRDGYEYNFPKGAGGLGVDVGIVYEWRPRHGAYKPRKVWPHRLGFRDQNKYKLKLGVSITDIGYIHYRNGVRDVFDISNTNVSEEIFEGVESIYDTFSSVYQLTNSTLGYTMVLPTALHLNVDYNLVGNFYLNFNTDVSLTSKNKLGASTITDVITVTPRYESKWFSFYMPFSVVQYGGFQVGAGFRLGPLYMGSGSLFNNIISEKSPGTNFYAGLKIPLFHKTIE